MGENPPAASALDLNSSAAVEPAPLAANTVDGVGEPPPDGSPVLAEGWSGEASAVGVAVEVSKKGSSENGVAAEEFTAGTVERAQSAGVDQEESSLERREVKLSVVLDLHDEKLEDRVKSQVKDDTFYDVKSESKYSESESAGDEDEDTQVEEHEHVKSAEVKTGKRGRPKRRDSVSETDQRARYRLRDLEDQTGFSVSDLIWGKVRSHPWWPGEIYDPKDASELALKLQKKDHFLVAYFGDKTFAWCDESQLKPFRPYFSQMARQSSMDAFVDAIDAVLEEVSRRIELGMCCPCLPEEVCAELQEQEVENAGIQEGTCCLAADRSQVISAFQPDRLIEFIQDLAIFPSGGADRLDLVMAQAQLRMFYQLKGYPELPMLLVGGGLVESDAEITSVKAKQSRTDGADGSTLTPPSDSTSGKRKRGRRSSTSKKKNAVDIGRKKRRLSELMEEEEGVPQIANDSGKASGKRKRKRLASLGDVETNTDSPSLGRSLKVGDSIRRVASKITGSPSIFKSNSESSQRRLAKGGVVTDNMLGSSVRTGRNKRRASRDYPPSSEALSQLCLVAREPLKGYSFLSVIDSFFTDFRAFVASGLPSSSPMEKKHEEGKVGRRGRKKSAIPKSASGKTDTSHYMSDSYWSDVIFQSSPEEEPLTDGRKKKRKSQAKRQKKKKKKKTARNMSLSPPSSLMSNTSLETKVGPGSPNITEDMEQLRNAKEEVDECKPTALILSFTESNALPSETDLTKFFSRYGPLEESETEVMLKTNRAKVVFKKLADAEVAFSSAGKYSIFGPALVSYSLKYLSSTPKGSPDSTPQSKKGVSTVEGGGLAASAEEEIRVASDTMQVDTVARGTCD